MSEQRVYAQVRFTRPEGSTELLLVRHGQSAVADMDHPFPLVNGRGDPPLSPLGVAQANATAQRLLDLELDAIFVTQLQRTMQTAEPLAAATGLLPVVETGLVEVSMGEWEGGVYRQRMAERHPLALRAFAEQRWDVIPGGESNESLAKRTAAALARIADAHRGGRVVLFVHAVVISSLLAQATGSEPFAFVSVDNASISELVVEGGRWHLRRFNDTAHLENLAHHETVAGRSLA